MIAEAVGCQIALDVQQIGGRGGVELLDQIAPDDLLLNRETLLGADHGHGGLARQRQGDTPLGEHLDAAGAGSRVGYDDAAHFNREYKSLFGLPPMRDVERLRQAVSTSTFQEG